MATFPNRPELDCGPAHSRPDDRHPCLTVLPFQPTIQNIEILLEKSRQNGGSKPHDGPIRAGQRDRFDYLVLDEDLRVIRRTPGAQRIDPAELDGAVAAAQSGDRCQHVVARIGGVDTEVAAAQIELIGGQRVTVVLTVRDPGADGADPSSIDAAVSRIALELLRARAEEERRARLADSLFHTLAGSRAVSLADVEELGIDLRGGNALVGVDAPPEPALCRRILTEAGGGELPPVVAFESGETVFALLTGLSSPGAERRLADTVVARLGRPEGGPYLRIAFAGPHPGPAGAQQALAECRHALRVLSLRSPTAEPTGFDELGIWTVLASADREQLTRFRDATLAPLVDHDARRRSQLMETLRALAAAGFNWRPASTALAVHPNTVRYRMSVITKLTGLDLGTYADQVKADVALRITELVGPA